MRVATKDIVAIYTRLFKDGCIVSFKDFTKIHPLFKIPNLQIVMVMKGLVSKKLVKETMNWRCLYWTLNDDGIKFLREKLCLPETAVPSTLLEPKQNFAVHEQAKQLNDRKGKHFTSEKKPEFKKDN